MYSILYVYTYIYIISYNFYLCLHIRGSNKQTWQHLTQVAGTTVHPLLTPIMKPGFVQLEASALIALDALLTCSYKKHHESKVKEHGSKFAKMAAGLLMTRQLWVHWDPQDDIQLSHETYPSLSHYTSWSIGLPTSSGL